MSPAGGALILFLLGQCVTVMSQSTPSSMLPVYNLSFPPLPKDFKETAKKLMIKCSQKGYSAPIIPLLKSSFMKTTENPMSLFPSLLSSLSSYFPLARSSLKPGTAESFEQDLAMNITEKMWNCTDLIQMIDLFRNTTEKTHCFMRAFTAYLSWVIIPPSVTWLNSEQLDKLLWAARPFLESTSPSPMTLPSKLPSSQMTKMMKFFSDIFTSLSEEQKEQIRRWMKERVIENESKCQVNQTLPSPITTKPLNLSISVRPEAVTVRPSVLQSQTSGYTTDMSRASVTEVEIGNAGNGGSSSNMPPKRARRASDSVKVLDQGGGKVQVNPTKAASPSDVQKSPGASKEVPQPGAGNDTSGKGAGKATEAATAKPETPDNNGKGIGAGNGTGRDDSKGLGAEKGQAGNEKATSPADEQKSPEVGKDIAQGGAGNDTSGKGVGKVDEAVTGKPATPDSNGKVTGPGRDYHKGLASENGKGSVDNGGNPMKNGTSNEEKTSSQGQKESDVKKNEETSGGAQSNGSKMGDEGGKNDVTEKHNKTDSITPSPGCPPKMPWLKAEVLGMMGRFISQLPEAEVKAILPEELCKFFQSPDFPSSLANVGRMQPVIGQALLQRLKRECFNSTQSFINQMDRLGSLACFFDDPQSLNVTLSKKLLSQLGDCENSGIDEMKRELVKKLMPQGDLASLTPELLKSLGFGASILPPSKLLVFSMDALNSTLSSLSQTSWKPAQAKVLAYKLLLKAENITVEKLLSLGSIVRGVDTELLKKVKAQELVGNEGLQNLSEKMSSLQKKALLVGIRANLSPSDVVKGVPDALLSSISLSTLEKANLSSLDQLEGRTWSRTQALYLLKKIVGVELKSEQIRKLGLAVQGITCNMVDSMNESNALEAAQLLTNSPNWLSRTQIFCIARKLFLSLEKQRPGYFTNINDSELQAIPTLLLIHLPVKMIQSLPDAVCPRLLEKMSQANLSSLPNSAPSRRELRDRALRCLGKNASDLSEAEVLSLGPLVCELDPAWISFLNSAALNSTLQAMASCVHIPYLYRGPLFMLLTKVYGNPSDWSEDVVKSLGPLLLLNETALEMITYKIWLKSALSMVLDNMPSQPAVPAPEEFCFWPNLSAMRLKLFQLQTKVTQQRRKRALSSLLELTSSVIETLGQGNVFWSPAQLANMTVQTFLETMSVLGEVRNYTAEQLLALRKKAMEALGNIAMLNETQIIELGCISQSFTPEQLQNLTITSLDTLDLLSECQWNQTQKAAIWQAFMDRNKIQVNKLGALDISGLGPFICGLQPNQIDQLNTGEFKEAVGDVGRAQCPLNILECLKRKVITLFGDPQTWSEADVRILGNIIAGLNGTELASLNCSVMSFIRQSAISLIPPECLAALSVSQLSALGPDNGAAVTVSQRSLLGAEQRAAVDAAVGGATPRSESTTSSPVPLPQKGGAPKPSVLGIVILLQPLALLLLGYIH